MKEISANNKRIAKNTLLLYIRMIVVTLLSLVTVRYLLRLLGNEDFGIYNVVAGVVTFLSFITANISSAAQRFLAFEIGQKNGQGYNDMFNMLIEVFFVIGIAIVVLLESLSYPLVYEWLNIPDDRQDVALIVFHFAVLSFFLVVVSIPFLSSIIANERMGVYAYVTIIDTIAKFAILALLLMDIGDNLVVYAICMAVVSVVVNGLYVIYNQRYIANTRLHYCWNGSVLKRVAIYMGWSFVGAASGVLCIQGLTILMNIFFGVSVSAAKGIADRVQGVIQSFVSNFYMAVSPQITKSYAEGDKNYTIKLAFTSTRLAYFLMLLLAIPVIILAPDLLTLWLGDECTPDMVLFTQWSLVFVLVNVFETPITFMMRATGDVKLYQISVGVVTLMVVPIAALLFFLGFKAYTAFVALSGTYAIAQLVRVVVLSKYYAVTLSQYIRHVLLSPLLISIVVVIVACTMVTILPLWISAAVLEVMTFALVWLIGLHNYERHMVTQVLIKKLKR